MTTQNYALINNAGAVTNIIVSDGTFEVPEGFTLVAVGSSGAAIGWTYSGGSFVAPIPPTPPTPTPAQLAEAALMAGIVIQSISDSALNGTYTISLYAQANINAEISSILLNNQFTNEQSTMDYVDAVGGSHTFTIAQFKAFATAFAAYSSALTLYALSNGAQGSIPTTPVQIP